MENYKNSENSKSLMVIEHKKNIVKLLKMSIIFLLLVAVTFYIFFKDNNIADILKVCSQVNIFYIFIGIIFMFVFILLEGLNIRRILLLLGNKVSILSALKYGLVGFFFSAITPSSSGGQPVQLYYMKKDKLSLSHSSLSLLIELSSFQLTTIILALVGFILNYHFIVNSMVVIKWLIFLGIFLNTFVLLILLLVIFSKRIVKKLLELTCRLLSFFKYKKVEEFKHKCDIQIEEYKSGAKLLKKNKKVLFKTVLTSVIQILLFYSIPFLVYLSFGLNNYTLLTFLGIQSVLFVSVSALPFPGAVGISEGAFILIYKLIYPSELLSSAMLLTRGINFYLFVLISGLGILIFGVKNIIKKKDLSHI